MNQEKETRTKYLLESLLGNEISIQRDEGEVGLLCDADEAAGGRGVKRSPALVVASVDIGPVFNEELDHLEVVVDARLESGNNR